MNNILEKAKEQGIEGRKINILIAFRKSLQNKLDDLNNNRYFSGAHISFDFVNSGGSTSSCLTYYEKNNIKYSTNLKYLGKNNVDQLNELETKIITDLLNMAKTHLELRIQLIDKLLEKIIV